MSKKDRIKAMLDILKSLLLTFLMALFGVFGYTFVHIEALSTTKILFLALSISVVAIIIAFIINGIVAYLNKLEKED